MRCVRRRHRGQDRYLHRVRGRGGADDDGASGWIDLDKASPGLRAWDLAHLAHRLVPLTSADYTGAAPLDLQRYRWRLRHLCEAYAAAGNGVYVGPAQVASSFVDMLQMRAEEADKRFAAGASELAGHGDFYRDELAWLFVSLRSLLEWNVKAADY